MLLYIVTDRTWLGGNRLEALVEQSVRAGATFVQLREKDLDFDAFVAEAKKIKAVTDRCHVPFVINDSVEVALAADADGVHVGQSDMNARDVRALIGRDKILGVSAQTVAQAVLAEQNGADYIGVGAMFSTATKTDAEVVTFDTLKEICYAVSIPVVAIGGIGEGNIARLKGSGIDGVAVVSAVFAAPDIAKATKNLLISAKELVTYQSAFGALGAQPKAFAKESIHSFHRMENSKIPHPMKKAFIFDLDGTLIDSMGAWDTVGHEYLASKCITDVPDNLREILTPISITESAEYFINTFGISGSVGQVCDEINEVIAQKYRHTFALKEGAAEFLERHRDKKCCVATATDRHLVELVLERLGIARYFDFIITSTEVGSSKQQPDIFLQAAERLGAQVDECVVFEDALHAVKTAKAAGFYTVGVYDRCFEDSAEEIRQYADQYVTDLRTVEI